MKKEDFPGYTWKAAANKWAATSWETTERATGHHGRQKPKVRVWSTAGVAYGEAIDAPKLTKHTSLDAAKAHYDDIRRSAAYFVHRMAELKRKRTSTATEAGTGLPPETAGS